MNHPHGEHEAPFMPRVDMLPQSWYDSNDLRETQIAIAPGCGVVQNHAFPRCFTPAGLVTV